MMWSRPSTLHPKGSDNWQYRVVRHIRGHENKKLKMAEATSEDRGHWLLLAE